ncbi:MAG: PilZ domain-containing protein [Thermodesulfobacteriota bacterium]
MIPAYQGKDRRKDRRVTLNVSVDYISRDGSKEGLIESTSMNISINGMCVEVKEELPIGTEVVLSFNLPNEPKRVWVMGKVRWSMRSENNRYIAGVLFEAIDMESKEMINRFINNSSTTYTC